VGSAATTSAAVKRDALLADASSAVATARLGDMLLPGGQGISAGASAASDPDAPRRYLPWVALVLAVGSLGMIAWRLARIAQARVRQVADGVPGGSGVIGGAVDDKGAASANAGRAGSEKG
jgi:hypothetical protein